VLEDVGTSNQNLLCLRWQLSTRLTFFMASQLVMLDEVPM